MARYTKAEQAEAKNNLMHYLKPGDTVHTVLRNASQSGMSRVITPFKWDGFGPAYLSRDVAAVLGWPRVSNTHDGVRVRGCGMDMGFHLVNSLSWALFGEGGKLKHRWL